MNKIPEFLQKRALQNQPKPKPNQNPPIKQTTNQATNKRNQQKQQNQATKPAKQQTNQANLNSYKTTSHRKTPPQHEALERSVSSEVAPFVGGVDWQLLLLSSSNLD